MTETSPSPSPSPSSSSSSGSASGRKYACRGMAVIANLALAVLFMDASEERFLSSLLHRNASTADSYNPSPSVPLCSTISDAVHTNRTEATGNPARDSMRCEGGASLGAAGLAETLAWKGLADANANANANADTNANADIDTDAVERNFTALATSDYSEYAIVARREAWDVLIYKPKGLCEIMSECLANVTAAAAAAAAALTAVDNDNSGKKDNDDGAKPSPPPEKAHATTVRNAQTNANAIVPRVLIRIQHNCEALFRHPSYGQGNWITSFYSNRWNALAAGSRYGVAVDYMFLCSDAEEQKKRLVLPWVAGFWPSRLSPLVTNLDYNSSMGLATAGSENDTIIPPWTKFDPYPSPHGFPWPYPPPPKRSAQLVANQCNRLDESLAHMVPHMMHDLRRMAVAAVGIPHPNHPSAKWSEQYLWSDAHAPLKIGPDVAQLSTPLSSSSSSSLSSSFLPPPLFPNLELDDAALHFRCGDLMASNHPSFGFMRYSAYSDQISPNARTIGIVTSPYGPNTADGTMQIRPGPEGRDRVKAACRKVVEGLRTYLMETFPNSIVSIRNDVNETVVTSYARLIMANQTIVGMGSFGVFPAVATFGRGYIRRPDFKKVANHWVKDLPDMFDHVELFDAPDRLMASQASQWQRSDDWDKMMDFFRGGK